jgi:hypothetical protein
MTVFRGTARQPATSSATIGSRASDRAPSFSSFDRLVELRLRRSVVVGRGVLAQGHFAGLVADPELRVVFL